ncbi:DUF732 domain-containing protein [Mycobacterium numidiamassiliense]|nr:DUF732 domain-containing protein [Mycobacterium numidiamassiliense]
MSRFKAVLMSVVALSLCAAPAVASADPDATSKYLATLEQHSISYKDPVQMVQIGTTLCHDLRHADGPPQAAVSKIQSSGFTDKQANVIAASAVLAFCPDMDLDAPKKPSSS